MNIYSNNQTYLLKIKAQYDFLNVYIFIQTDSTETIAWFTSSSSTSKRQEGETICREWRKHQRRRRTTCGTSTRTISSSTGGNCIMPSLHHKRLHLTLNCLFIYKFYFILFIIFTRTISFSTGGNFITPSRLQLLRCRILNCTFVLFNYLNTFNIYENDQFFYGGQLYNAKPPSAAKMSNIKLLVMKV